MTNRPIPLASTNENEIVDMPWGTLVWMVARRFGNSDTMTVGRCHIPPGKENQRHLHPNCDEVVHLLQGSIEHSYDCDTVSMESGDTLSIPSGIPHNARNTGDVEAVFLIVFSSAEREITAERPIAHPGDAR